MTENAPDEKRRRELERKDALFEKYYVQYRERMYWYVFRRISRHVDAEDITADVFVKLYENLDELESRGRKGILAWLYTVARNGSIDYLRKQKGRNTQPMEEEELDSVVKVFDDFVQQEMKEGDLSDVRTALSVVDEITYEIMQLRFEEGMKFHEIAEVVGKSEGACKMIMYRGLDKVRAELEKQHEHEQT